METHDRVIAVLQSDAPRETCVLLKVEIPVDPEQCFVQVIFLTTSVIAVEQKAGQQLCGQAVSQYCVIAEPVEVG